MDPRPSKMNLVRLSLLLLLALPAYAGPAPARWWDDAWEARHPLVLPERRPPDSDAALVEMSTFGRLRPDAVDLRVVTASGKPCDHRLISVGPGDFIRFLFRPVEGERKYFAYFGNPDARPPARELVHDAGLVLEVRDLPRGAFSRAQEVLALWDRATRVQGRTLRPRIFDGTNPVGPAARFIARYVGRFRARDGGAYRFVTASSDASVVAVDGQVVAAWGGVHHAAAGRNARFGGTVDLEPGLHTVAYTWVKAGGQPPAAVLAWQPPGDRFPWIMPPNAFVRPVPVRVGPIEMRKGRALADFFWTTLHHIENGGQQAVCVQLRENTGLGAPDLQFRWVFPDGSRAAGRKVRKVFFGSGPRIVKLVLARGGSILSGEQRVGVHPVWTQTRPPRGKALQDYVRALDALDPAAATPGELTAAIALADPLDRAGRLGELWEALETRPRTRDDPAFAAAALLLGRRLQLPPFCSGDDAERALRAGAAVAADERTRAELWLRLADLLVNARGDGDAAEAVLGKLKGIALEHAAQRRAAILRGDIAAQRGRTEEALSFYERAGSTASPWDRRSEIRRAAALLSAEDFVRRKEYAQAIETLGGWLLVQPTERLDPRCLLTLGRAYAGSGFSSKAFVLLERALRLDPWGASAPRLLLRLVAARRDAGDEEAASAGEKILLERFPYSEEAALLQARRRGIQAEGDS